MRTHRLFEKTVNLADYIYEGIEDNAYLKKLYEKMLLFYGERRIPSPSKDVTIPENHALSIKEKEDLLSFADILSKSHIKGEEGDRHKNLAQEIVAVLMDLYPDDEDVQLYAGSVYTSVVNFEQVKKTGGVFNGLSILDRAVTEAQREKLRVHQGEQKEHDSKFNYYGEQIFLPQQKEIFDNIGKGGDFSFSAPTSLGKTYVMKEFIRAGMASPWLLDFAIVVPSIALINELRSDLISQMGEIMKENGYSIVTSASDIAMFSDRHIFIMTPERMQSLLMLEMELNLSVVFIDEAHRISISDTRSALYYKLLNQLGKINPRPKVVFSSPAIPNPDVYLRLGNEMTGKDTATNFSPVAQVRFFVDLEKGELAVYNRDKRDFQIVYDGGLHSSYLYRLIYKLSLDSPVLVYCHTKENAFTFAHKMSKMVRKHWDARGIPDVFDNEGLKKLGERIANEVHPDYYLCHTVKYGIAYHLGSVPETVRREVETAFREKKIRILFCTSTVTEGVNLPCKNLVVTSYFKGRNNLEEVEFNNLLGRAGRLRYDLDGCVFLCHMSEGQRGHSRKGYLKRLKAGVRSQGLSVDSLSEDSKEKIVELLKTGSTDLSISGIEKKEWDTAKQYTMLLLQDVVNSEDNTLVRKSFSDVMQHEDITEIREAFADKEPTQEIDCTVEEQEQAKEAVDEGVISFPEGEEITDDLIIRTQQFIADLEKLYHWGYKPDWSYRPRMKDIYARLLLYWMNGDTLSDILKRTLAYREKTNYPMEIHTNGEGESFVVRCFDSLDDDSINEAINDDLSALRGTVQFLFTTAFQKISEMLRAKQGNVISEPVRLFLSDYDRSFDLFDLAMDKDANDELENDWYLFARYGTRDRAVMYLQRCGFSRDVALYVCAPERRQAYIEEVDTDIYQLNKETFFDEREHNTRIRKEAEEVKLNLPNLFA